MISRLGIYTLLAGLFMGLFTGISSAAAVSTAVQLARRLERGVVVTIMPDSGFKYLSERFWREFSALALNPAYGLYRLLSAPAIGLLHRIGRKRGAFSRLPLAEGWTSQRDFPAPQGGTFMSEYARRQKKAKRR